MFFLDPTILQQSALMAHNKLRTLHRSPPLELSELLSKEAENYAHEIVIQNRGILDHSPRFSRPGQGENLAMHCSPHNKELTGSQATVKW